MISSHLKKGLNFAYFHRRRIFVATGFCGTYGYLCKKMVDHPNELLRMGIAGSFAHVTVEAMFHFVDTVNVQSKLGDQNLIYGFSRGFSAMFYGSVICGFIYFSGYKFLKNYLKEKFGETQNITMLFFLAAFVAEFFTLIIYYPYDLIKCRL